MYISAVEVMEILDVSRAYAYNVIKELNNELNEQGYYTISGRTPRRFFFEKFYIYNGENENVSIQR